MSLIGYRGTCHTCGHNHDLPSFHTLPPNGDRLLIDVLNHLETPSDYKGRSLSIEGRVKMMMGDFDFNEDGDQYA